MNKRITSILIGVVMGCAVVANAMPVFADDPCTHENKTTVSEQASNCTDRGWDEHQLCTACGAPFDMDGYPLDDIPYRELNDNHDFDLSQWGYKEADGHARVCTRNWAHIGDIEPHNPDHEGGSTTEYAVTCTECGYVIDPQVKQIEVPFQLVVEKTGEKAPGPETFRFIVEKFNAPVDFTIVKDTVETNGENTYTGSFIFTMKESLGNLAEGFVIRQVIGSADGWTYDETKFFVEPLINSDEEIYNWTIHQLGENEESDGTLVREIRFTNRYYAANPTLPYLPPRPEKPTAPEEIIEPEVPLEPEAPMEPSVPTAPAIPTEAPTPDVPEEIKQPPQTGDNSNSALWISLLLVSGSVAAGTAIASQKRKSKDK